MWVREGTIILDVELKVIVTGFTDNNYGADIDGRRGYPLDTYEKFEVTSIRINGNTLGYNSSYSDFRRALEDLLNRGALSIDVDINDNVPKEESDE